MNFVEKEVKIKKDIKVPAEIYSRIVGYFRPINQWNRGKREEFKDRKTTNIFKGVQNEKNV